MKNNFAQIFFLIVSTLSSVQMFAEDPPPPPPLPPPPGFPIDSGVVVLYCTNNWILYYTKNI